MDLGWHADRMDRLSQKTGFLRAAFDKMDAGARSVGERAGERQAGETSA